jgi:ATP-dependent Lhr-like helicase
MTDPAFTLLHPGVQKAIWSLNWKQLHQFQVQAINTVLQTEQHLVICAQTAGGKTEAAFLPILSRLAEKQYSSVQAMYIGPLKALINDQFERLEFLCQHIDIPVHRWHGDVPANKKKALRESPGGVLLITPESLESNFINFGSFVSRIYQHLQFVVIDELHSFLSNVRGVHLRSLLARLVINAHCKPRIIGLSATLADPSAGCAFIAPDDPDSVDVINDTLGQREVRFGMRAYLRYAHWPNTPRLNPTQAQGLIEQVTTESFQNEHVLSTRLSEPKPGISPAPAAEPDELDEIADDTLRAFKTSTNLIFGNSKQSLEILADRLHRRVRLEKWPNDPFVVHHGSLSKDLRSEAEELLKSGKPTTALCSSTLEMGIDIGYVRAIGQLDPPWSVASMVQRLGRSGRRENDAAVMRMYVRDDSPCYKSTLTDLLFPNLLRAVALTRLMIGKWLEPVDAGQLHLSTLVHQILSCLKQTGGSIEPKLYQILVCEGPFRKVDRDQFRLVLRDLAQNELIEQMPQGELILAPAGERLTADADFYAAFQAPEEYSIRHGTEEIGKLQSSLVPPEEETLILGGRRWVVDEILHSSKIVVVSVSRGGKPPMFLGTSGEIHSRITEEMRAVLHDSDNPAYLDANGIVLLQAARQIATTSGLLRSDVLRCAGVIRWYPWVGTRALLTLGLHAKAAGIPHESDALSITYHFKSDDDFVKHLCEVTNGNRTGTELAVLLPVKKIEKYDGFLSDALLDNRNACDYVDMGGAQAAARYVWMRCKEGES